MPDVMYMVNGEETPAGPDNAIPHDAIVNCLEVETVIPPLETEAVADKTPDGIPINELVCDAPKKRNDEVKSPLEILVYGDPHVVPAVPCDVTPPV